MIVEQNNNGIVKQAVNVNVPEGHTISVVYGSLRKGCYNCASYERAYGDGYQQLTQAWITGYKLYSLGAYPCVVFTGEEEDKLLVDIYQCSRECHNSIYRMEIGAGYYAKTIEVMGDDGNAYEGIIYCYEESDYTEKLERVVDGDWVTYVNNRTAARYNNQ